MNIFPAGRSCWPRRSFSIWTAGWTPCPIPLPAPLLSQAADALFFRRQRNAGASKGRAGGYAALPAHRAQRAGALHGHGPCVPGQAAGQRSALRRTEGAGRGRFGPLLSCEAIMALKGILVGVRCLPSRIPPAGRGCPARIRRKAHPPRPRPGASKKCIKGIPHERKRLRQPRIFEKYSRMARSQLGLAGAGGWPALQPVLPPFEGRRVLGLDISERMLAVAGGKNAARAPLFTAAAP